MRDNIIIYGEVSDEQCANCHNCSGYELSYDYNYTKFFFISFHERNRKYYLRCKNCRVYSEIGRPKAQYIIDTKFGEIERKRKRKLRLKNTITVLLICAAISCITYGLLYDPDMFYKNLVADKPDGYYEIYDREGKICAQITKDKEIRYNLLVKRETVHEEDYDNIDEDLYNEYYYSEQEGSLKYIEENAGVLVDKNNVAIQYYYYDTAEKDIRYYFGVDDFSKIIYAGNRAVYPMTLYSEQNKSYWKVHETSENCEIVMMFGDTLENIKLYTLESGRTAKYEYYDLLSRGDLSGGILELDKESSLYEVVEALKASGMQPAFTEEFISYKDTGVAKSVFIRSTDPSTGISVNKKIDYIVEEKGGYYIVTPDARKFGEKVAWARPGEATVI